MKPKDERFADNRVDRFSYDSYLRLARFKLERKRVAKRYAKQAKALRLDKRFALVELGLSLCNHCDLFRHGLFSRKLEEMKLHNSFNADEYIPHHLWEWIAAHRAQCDNTKIACYPTMADAMRKREVVMSAGRFFTATMPTASASEIQAMAERFIAATRPVVISWAESPEDWSRVYCNGNGFSSCMSKFDDDECHPARFYAYPGNGLKLAYIQSKTGIAARCIVNMDRKTYVRVYGDARLGQALDSEGFTHSPSNSLKNVKCNAHEGNNGLVAPYLDSIGRVQWNGADNFCVITANGNYDAQCTEGYAELEDDRSCCDYCEDRTDDDDMHYSEYHGDAYCTYCNDRYRTCAIVDRRSNQDWVNNDETVTIESRAFLNDDDVLSAHNFVCIDGDWHDLDDAIFLEYLDDYVLFDNVVKLDIAHGEDSHALECNTMIVTIEGEEKCVHEDYDGMTDEKRAHARRVARMNAAKKIRKFSRAPNRRKLSRNRLKVSF